MSADVTQIPSKGDQGSIFLVWYQSLVSQFGVSVANQIFLKCWKTRGSSSSSTTELRQALSKNGVDIDKGILSSIVDTGESALHTIGGIFSVGKYVTYAVVGIVVIGLGIAIFQIAKNPAVAVGTALKA